MIVNCSTMREFIEEIDTQIKKHGTDCVYQKTIRLSVEEQPLQDNEKQPRNSVVRWEVALKVSAVMDLGDGGQYLLQAREICGIDYRDASNELNGSEELEKRKMMIKSFCNHHSIRIGPGVIQV